MDDHKKNIMIGAFAIAAVAILIYVLFYINPFSLRENGQTLIVRFHNIDKVTVGTRVNYAGQPVGEVTKIELVPIDEARDEAEENDTPIFSYELTLEISKNIQVYNTDEITIRTSGLLGERSVVIIPKKPKPHQPVELLSAERVYTSDPGKSFEDILDTLEKNNFWDNIGIVSKNVKDITDAINDQKALKETVCNIRDFSKSLKQLTDKINGRADVIVATIDDFSNTATYLRDFSNKISSGEGTLGRLIDDDSLYLQLSSLLTKGETLMNDVNHYGILFHLNKQWQRERTRRLNQLYELSSAFQFRRYLNEEMDSVSTSLSRVSILLEKAEEQGQEKDLCQNKQYTQTFYDLLRRVNDIQERLEAYNAQINSSEGYFPHSNECIRR